MQLFVFKEKQFLRRKSCKKNGFFLKKWYPFLGTNLVPQNGGQRSGTQPFVPFRCPPFLGAKFGTQKWVPTFFFLEPIFRFRSFRNSLPAANGATWDNWLCFSFPVAAFGITSSCRCDGVLPPPLSSSRPLVACWHTVGFLIWPERFICLHGWAHCRRSDLEYVDAFQIGWNVSNSYDFEGRCHQLAMEQWARRRCRPDWRCAPSNQLSKVLKKSKKHF